MTVTGMLIYSVLIILHYYCIIIFYYDNIILSYYYITLAQYSIYWHFSNHGFCSRMAPYQWFWIIKDCFRHRISARIFSRLKKDWIFIMSLFFVGPRPLGPGPMVQGPWGPWGPSLGDGESYLQSGKATYCQACTQQPHTCTQPSHRHALKSRIHAPKSIHRLAPNNRILCTQPSHRHAPKRHRFCTQKA